MTRRKPNHPTSPPSHPHKSSNNHRRNQSHHIQTTTAAPTLQTLHAAHDAPASLEQLNALNFPVLQRFLPSLIHIHLTTSYSTAYKIKSGNWEKLDIEGPLFLLELNHSHPQFIPPTATAEMIPGFGKYCAFVLNRKGLNNLLIPLPRKLENVDTTNSVLISMLMAWEDCYGLSVFDQEGTSTASESERVGEKVLELVKEMEEDDARQEEMRKEVQQHQQQQHQQHGGYYNTQPHHQGQYSGTPGFGTPTTEFAGVDLMAALGPKLGINVGGSGGVSMSGYNSGDGGYTSAASNKGRKISLNELFGKSLG